ncbi:chemotaxis protein CheW [Nitrincola iocasae]|jgi:purine-binding chemotaxis protein CheW|nr:chemotaxis protein CheW [Nitrincola iocasae]
MTETLEGILAARQASAEEIVDVDEPVIKLVIFSLGERDFAFPGEAVGEVLPGTEPVYFVPGMPPAVEGVMNVRGDIESVIRLHNLLQLNDPGDITRHSAILLAKGKKMHSGLRIDRLLDVVDIPASQIQPPPESLPEHLHQYVTGLLQFKQHAIAVLDLDSVFSAWQGESG